MKLLLKEITCKIYIRVFLVISEATMFTSRHGSGHFRYDNFGNVIEHFYDSTCMTILILS